MADIRIANSYNPLPTQLEFHSSRAKAKGYGGAMGGGKSRALCEEAYQAALEYPGIEIVMARAEHTAISISTRKTMFREVLPQKLVKYCRVVKSGGFDFIEFPNGSVIHFVGLNDPVKFHSTEFGLLIIDEAHQVSEDDVQTLNTRLRQKCNACLQTNATDCSHLPLQILCGFNPENPGHWLYKWFIGSAEKTRYGYYKRELRLEEDAKPLGEAEFVQARAMDNPYLPETYIERELGGMKEFQRRRYLEGEWLFISGQCYFDQEILADYMLKAPKPLYRFDFEASIHGDKARQLRHDLGKIRVFREVDDSHAYAIGVDVATGRGLDYSAAYVVDLTDMALVCEFHGKIDPDLFAEQLHFLGRYYNTAWIAVEQAGGYGEPVIISLRDGREGRPAYPRQYRHVLDSSVALDTVSRYGYPISMKTRPHVLSQLERAIRDKILPWMPPTLITECLTFCHFEDKSPDIRAQPGCNDDTVMACAITLEMYRRYGHHEKRERRIAARRRKREKQNWYPWQQKVPA